MAALFAGRLTPTDRMLGRLTVELLAPVPFAPLQLDISPSEGGRRVQRQRATLTAAGRIVASAQSVTVLRADLDLPAAATANPDPFASVPAPSLIGADPALADVIGWENFHSTAVATRHLRSTDAPGRTHQWIALTVPVVAGTPIQGTENAAAAADFASEAVHRRLPFTEWSFMNADLTVHLTRAPIGSWVGIGTPRSSTPRAAGSRPPSSSTKPAVSDNRRRRSSSSHGSARRAQPGPRLASIHQCCATAQQPKPTQFHRRGTQ